MADILVSANNEYVEDVLIWVRNKSISSFYAYRRCPICDCTWYPDQLVRHNLTCWVPRLQYEFRNDKSKK